MNYIPAEICSRAAYAMRSAHLQVHAIACRVIHGFSRELRPGVNCLRLQGNSGCAEIVSILLLSKHGRALDPPKTRSTSADVSPISPKVETTNRCRALPLSYSHIFIALGLA